MAADVQPADWRLKAFDDANSALSEMERQEREILVREEPTLKDYEDRLMLPWREAVAHLRRLIFLKRLKEDPEKIRMEPTPWAWALDSPRKREDLKALLSGDGGQEIEKAYDDMLRTLEALHAREDLLAVRNSVYGKHRAEMHAIEESLTKKLNAIQESVSGRLRSTH